MSSSEHQQKSIDELLAEFKTITQSIQTNFVLFLIALDDIESAIRKDK